MKERSSRLPNLRRERKLRGWSQAYVAAMVGSDMKSVGRWERGEHVPDPYHMQRLIDLFGKNAAELGLLAEHEVTPGIGDYQYISHQDWGEAPAVASFYGRTQELSEASEAMLAGGCRVILILGLGGIGKTTFVTKLAWQAQDTFHFLFWRSLQSAPPLRTLLEDCLFFLANPPQFDTAGSIDHLIGQLISCLRNRRTLLILDNFESVLRSGHAAGQYLKGYEEYGRLLQRLGEAEHQSCLIITSREKPAQIAALEGPASAVRSIYLPGINSMEGRKLIEHAGLTGTAENWDDLVRLYGGNPLALKVIAESIREVFGGKIASFLQDQEIVLGDIYPLLDQQFERLTACEQEIMYWLAIEREALTLEQLRANIIHYIAQRTLIESINSLRRRSMIETSAHASFSLQPVIMEYVTTRFVAQIYREIETETIHLLEQHALLKAQTKDYIRSSQVRFVLTPIIESLRTTLGISAGEKKLQDLLSTLRARPSQWCGYAAGNILNLLVQAQTDLRDLDCSRLTIRQAYLRGVALPDSNFDHACFTDGAFTDTFGAIHCVVFSPDGELLAAGTADGEIRIWQRQGWAQQYIYQGHTDGVRSIVFTPDSKLLISGSDDHTIRIWEAGTGQCLKTLEGHTSVVRAVACSSDGRLLASGSEDRTVRLWNIDTGQCTGVLQGHTHWVRAVVFSSHTQTLASGGNDGTIRRWDTQTGQCLAILRGHTQVVRSLAAHPLKHIFASSSDDETIRLWDVDSSHCLNVLKGHTYPIRSLAFNSDGQLLASGGDDQIVRIWDTETGRCLQQMRRHTKRIWSVAFSPESHLLASGGEDQAIALWDTHANRCLQVLQGYSSWIWSITFRHDGKFLASGGEDQTIRLWHVETGHCIGKLQGHENRVRAVAFNPRNHLLASSSDDQTIRLWDTDTGRCRNILRGHNHLIKALAFNPDGTILASGSDDQSVRLWNVGTGRCTKILQRGHGPISHIAFSPEGRLFASSSDGFIRIWDLLTGQHVHTLQGHTDQVWCVSFSPDGSMLASAGDDRTIRIWDVHTGNCLQILRGHTHWVRTIAFSPHHNHIIASGSHDQTLRIWNLDSQQPSLVLKGHSSWIWEITFSPNGHTLASGSDDGSIKLWEAHTGVCLKTLIGERPYEGMNISGTTGLPESQKNTLKALGAWST